MGCQSAVRLGENLPFSFYAHDPDTGEVTDPDSDPTYRIYEEGNPVAILTGTVPLFDAVNTTGLCLKVIACIAANGFETGKGYTIAVEAIVDGDTGGISFGFRVGNSTLAEEVWAYTPRTLTQLAASVAAALAGSDINILRGDTVVVTLTGLGDISDRTKLWLTIREAPSDADSESVVQVEETIGLVYLNGAAAGTPTDSSLVVDDQVAGDITWTLKPAASATLTTTTLPKYDVQVLRAAGVVNTLTQGDATISADTTRAIA